MINTLSRESDSYPAFPRYVSVQGFYPSWTYCPPYFLYLTAMRRRLSLLLLSGNQSKSELMVLSFKLQNSKEFAFDSRSFFVPRYQLVLFGDSSFHLVGSFVSPRSRQLNSDDSSNLPLNIMADPRVVRGNTAALARHVQATVRFAPHYIALNRCFRLTPSGCRCRNIAY